MPGTFGQSGGEKSEKQIKNRKDRGEGLKLQRALYARVFSAYLTPASKAVAARVGNIAVIGNSTYTYSLPKWEDFGTPFPDTAGYGQILFGQEIILTKGFVMRLIDSAWKETPEATEQFKAKRTFVENALAHTQANITLRGELKSDDKTHKELMPYLMVCFHAIGAPIVVSKNPQGHESRSILNQGELPTIFSQMHVADVAKVISNVLRNSVNDEDLTMDMLKKTGLKDWERRKGEYRTELLEMFSSERTKKRFRPFVDIYRWSIGEECPNLRRAIQLAGKYGKKSPSLYGRSAADLKVALQQPNALDVVRELYPRRAGGSKRKDGKRDAAAGEDKSSDKFVPAKDAPIGVPSTPGFPGKPLASAVDLNGGKAPAQDDAEDSEDEGDGVSLEEVVELKVRLEIEERQKLELASQNDAMQKKLNEMAERIRILSESQPLNPTGSGKGGGPSGGLPDVDEKASEKIFSMRLESLIRGAQMDKVKKGAMREAISTWLSNADDSIRRKLISVTNSPGEKFYLVNTGSGNQVVFKVESDKAKLEEAKTKKTLYHVMYAPDSGLMLAAVS